MNKKDFGIFDTDFNLKIWKSKFLIKLFGVN